ncbi:MAG: FAD-dependent oxidoreductase, partial [Candidatus Marinimicrobia bacterium]|nr:FAD-dependent oxidoreductase [Candidatus Neomarinimicrobiota bacterium]
VKFYFDDKELFGYENEMVSSALIANGIKEFSIHQKNDMPQGIFCANGQCSKCTLIIDGVAQKSCITPLKENMRIETLKKLPKLPADDEKLGKHKKKELKCEVLVVGGGPSGLNAAIELAKLNYSVILIDDKEQLGGKLVLQTHKFFGSIKDCYAGTRGIDIAKKLENEIREYDNIKILTNSSVVGIFKDQKVGVFQENKNYLIISFDGIVVSAGAREKSLVFPGNHLSGVYGAGAFQTLVNRDLIHSSDKIFIVGSGNVGLIAAYHALQAGIKVAGICDILSDVSGYKVHADKIKRMGVPIHLNHTVLSANGNKKLEKVTITKVDDKFRPVLETAKTFEVDTLLIAVGLNPVDEFYNMAKKFNFKVVKAGDAKEIAEASSAMFGGKIAGLEMAKKLGNKIKIDESYFEKADILKSPPGKIHPIKETKLTDKYQPIIYCDQEIPCNPCVSVCPNDSIKLDKKIGNILDIPKFKGGCSGCTKCVTTCPGLAITLAKKIDEKHAEVMLPYEFIMNYSIGEKIPLTNMDGKFLETGEILKIRYLKKKKMYLINVKTSLENGNKIAGIRVQDESITKPLPKADYEYIPEDAIVCQCEMVTVKEITDYIKKHRVRDVNQLKNIRVGMGACGGKTCSPLLPRIFKMAGVDWNDVKQGTDRPLNMEVPMGAIVNEESLATNKN